MGMILSFHSVCFALNSSETENIKKVEVTAQSQGQNLQKTAMPNTPNTTEASSLEAGKAKETTTVLNKAEKNSAGNNQKTEAEKIANFKYILMTENFPPFNYEENGKVTGIATEIIREMFRRLGMEDIPIKIMNWDKAYQITLEKPNTIIFSLTKISERKSKFKWVGPIATNYWYLFAKKQPAEKGNNNFIKISRLKDAEKYKIGVQEKGAICQYLQSKGFTNLVEAKTNELCAQNHLDGKVQLWGESELAVASLLRNLKKNPNIVRKVFKLRKHNLYIGFNINTPDSEIKEFQAVLDQMKNDGAYDKIVNKYYNRLYLETIKEGEVENVHPKEYTINN